MTRKEAILWLRAIIEIEDELEPDDPRDRGRVQAVKLAIKILQKKQQKTLRKK